jgi:hypothetical protein
MKRVVERGCSVSVLLHLKFPGPSPDDDHITSPGSSKSESTDVRGPWQTQHGVRLTSRSSTIACSNLRSYHALVLQLEQELGAATYAICSIVTTDALS